MDSAVRIGFARGTQPVKAKLKPGTVRNGLVMKKTFVAIAIVLAFPALAPAGLVTMVARDVPLGGRSLQAVASPIRFNMLGVHWRGPGAVEYRTLSTTGHWSSWSAADADSGPDPTSSESRAAAGTHDGNLAWVG